MCRRNRTSHVTQTSRCLKCPAEDYSIVIRRVVIASASVGRVEAAEWPSPFNEPVSTQQSIERKNGESPESTYHETDGPYYRNPFTVVIREQAAAHQGSNNSHHQRGYRTTWITARHDTLRSQSDKSSETDVDKNVVRPGLGERRELQGFKWHDGYQKKWIGQRLSIKATTDENSWFVIGWYVGIG